MPFGKHQGEPLEAVPAPYLVWLRGREWLFDDLRAAVELELARRRQQRMFVAPGLGLAPEVRSAAAELVAAGYRVLARGVHPDAGGDHEAMVRLNLAAEALRQVVAA